VTSLRGQLLRGAKFCESRSCKRHPLQLRGVVLEVVRHAGLFPQKKQIINILGSIQEPICILGAAPMGRVGPLKWLLKMRCVKHARCAGRRHTLGVSPACARRPNHAQYRPYLDVGAKRGRRSSLCMQISFFSHQFQNTNVVSGTTLMLS
jgi:hypothetical protein